MKHALKQLLDTLDELFEDHEELGDTEVRERMAEAVQKALILPQPQYSLPATYGMFTRAGNRKLRTVLQQFLKHPEVTALAQQCQTPADRLTAFQDVSVKSAKGRTYDDFFGQLRKGTGTPESSSAINLAVLKRSRRAPRPGDVFVMMPPDGFYLFGRVISNSACAGFNLPCILIYIYTARSNGKTPVPELLVEDLLVPPIMTLHSLWTKGYFEFIENHALTAADRLPQHCFRDSYGRFHDENCKELPAPTEPVGQWGLATVGGIGRAVSKALGITVAPDP